MQAIVLDEYGAPDVLRLRDIPDLEATGEQVRVRVIATAVNRADIMQRRGNYPPPKPVKYEIPGLEFAGVVDAVGDGVVAWKEGDRVFGLLSGGGYADRVVVHERMLMAIPDSLSFVEAAAIPEVFFTAYDALLDKGNFQSGDAVLIHAGGSGVGTAAIQLAKAMGASFIFTTSRTQWKLDKCAEMGADRGINTQEKAFEEAIKEIRSDGVDVILDFVGGAYLEQNLQAVARDGRIVIISTLGGSRTEIDLRQMMLKRIQLRGTTLRSRPAEQKMVLTQKFARQMLPLLATKRLYPVIDRTFSLAEAADAHRYMEQNSNFGKIVLEVNG